MHSVPDSGEICFGYVRTESGHRGLYRGGIRGARHCPQHLKKNIDENRRKLNNVDFESYFSSKVHHDAAIHKLCQGALEARLRIEDKEEEFVAYTGKMNSLLEKCDKPNCSFTREEKQDYNQEVQMTTIEEDERKDVLFVLLTMVLPERQMKQAFGRSARSGKPGVTQMVIDGSKSFHPMAHLKDGSHLSPMARLAVMESGMDRWANGN